MEVFKSFKVFGLYFYVVSSIRMKRRRSVDEKVRNRSKLLRKYKNVLYGEQDGRCGECGRWFPPDSLEIHHIIGISENPNLMLAKRNLRLLCPECHKALHCKKDGSDGSDVSNVSNVS